VTISAASRGEWTQRDSGRAGSIRQRKANQALKRTAGSGRWRFAARFLAATWFGRIYGAYAMKKKNYKSILAKLKREIKDTKNHAFHDVDDWTMANDLLNGVLIGYTINERSDRELLHRIGLKYSLIPLCPGEVVDIDVSDDHRITRSFVRTMFGKMQISPKKG
jgi:hypothetical protein